MANSDKNIVITPNVGQTADPQIVFSGADASTTAQNITVKVYPTNNGTLSFEGSAGQLFSITNSFTGTIFSVNDVSGVPSIEVLDTGVVKVAEFSGNVLLGTATDNGTDKLQVNGSITGTVLKSSVASGTAPFTVASTTTVTNLSADTLDGVDSSSFLRSDTSDSYTSGTLTFNSGTTLTAASGATVNFSNAQGTAPFTVESTTTVTNLSADTLDGVDSSSFLRSDTSDSYTSGTLTFNSGTTVNFSNAQGTAPFTVTSTTVVTNLNADLLDGISSADFLQTSGNQSASGIKTFTNNTGSTSTTSGTVVVTGGVGISENLYIGGDETISGIMYNGISPNITATGTTQAGAVLITSLINNVVAGINGGVRLPAATTTGTRIVIRNDTIGDINIYPQTNGKINLLSQNAPYVLVGGAAIEFAFVGVTDNSTPYSQWFTLNAVF